MRGLATSLALLALAERAVGRSATPAAVADLGLPEFARAHATRADRSLGTEEACDWSAWEIADLAYTAQLMRHPVHNVPQPFLEVLEPLATCVPLAERGKVGSPVPDSVEAWKTRPWWEASVRSRCPAMDVLFRSAEYSQRFDCFDRMIWKDPSKTSLKRAQTTPLSEHAYSFRVRARGRPSELQLDGGGHDNFGAQLLVTPGELLVVEATAQDPSQCGDTLIARLRGSRLVIQCPTVSLYNGTHWILCPIPQHLPEKDVTGTHTTAGGPNATIALEFITTLEVRLHNTDFTHWLSTPYYPGWAGKPDTYVFHNERVPHDLPPFLFEVHRFHKQPVHRAASTSATASQSMPSPSKRSLRFEEDVAVQEPDVMNAAEERDERDEPAKPPATPLRLRARRAAGAAASSCDASLDLYRAQERGRCGAPWFGYWYVPNANASQAAAWFAEADRNKSTFWGNGWSWVLDSPNGGDPSYAVDPSAVPVLSPEIVYSEADIALWKQTFSRFILVGDSTDRYNWRVINDSFVKPSSGAPKTPLKNDPFFTYYQLFGMRTVMSCPAPGPGASNAGVFPSEQWLDRWFPSLNTAVLTAAKHVEPTAAKPWLLTVSSAIHDVAFETPMTDFLGALSSVFQAFGHAQVLHREDANLLSLRKKPVPIPTLSPSIRAHTVLVWRRPQVVHAFRLPPPAKTHGFISWTNSQSMGRMEMFRAFGDAVARLHQIPSWDTTLPSEASDNYMPAGDIRHFDHRGCTVFFRVLLQSIESGCLLRGRT